MPLICVQLYKCTTVQVYNCTKSLTNANIMPLKSLDYIFATYDEVKKFVFYTVTVIGFLLLNLHPSSPMCGIWICLLISCLLTSCLPTSTCVPCLLICSCSRRGSCSCSS